MSQPSVERWLRLLSPAVAPSLIDDAALTELGRIASILPAAFGRTKFFLECPLGTPAPVADLSVSAWAALGGREALIAMSTALNRASAGRWRNILAFAQKWASQGSTIHGGVDGVWLEFDADAGQDAPPLPSVFISLRPTEPSADGSTTEHPLLGRAAIVTVEAVQILSGTAMEPNRLDLLRTCFHRLPSSARVRFVGAMLPRNTLDLRLIVRGLRPDQILWYLQSVGLSPVPNDLPPVLDAVAPHLTEIWLALDVGCEVGSRVGLECYSSGPGWAEVLGYLVERGLCLPAKADAVLSYPVQEGHTAARQLARRIHHLKISCRPGTLPEAKAYLAACTAARFPLRLRQGQVTQPGNRWRQQSSGVDIGNGPG